jgi:hypothetical protein
MDYLLCERLLNQTLQQAPQLAKNISLITARARGDDKAACTALFGGINKISSYITAYDQWLIAKVPLDPNQIAKTSNSNAPLITSTGTSNQPTFDPVITGNTIVVWAKSLIALAALFFLGLIFYKIIRYLAIFLYDVRNADRMIYLKILQTRGDSKTDREANRELAKDMKEKISRMSQVYNNFYVIEQSRVYEAMMATLCS